jgi:hypothetical protein
MDARRAERLVRIMAIVSVAACAGAAFLNVAEATFLSVTAAAFLSVAAAAFLSFAAEVSEFSRGVST